MKRSINEVKFLDTRVYVQNALKFAEEKFGKDSKEFKYCFDAVEVTDIYHKHRGISFDEVTYLIRIERDFDEALGRELYNNYYDMSYDRQEELQAMMWNHVADQVN